MDVYKIGIQIAMQNNVSGVIQLIQKQLLHLNSTVTKVAQNLGRLKLAIAGAATAYVGVEIFKGLNDLARHGEKYTHQLELMKDAGMKALEVQQAISAANRVSSEVPTSTPTENLETIRELRMALASADVRPGGKADPAQATKEAIAHLATFQKITGEMSSILSKNGQPFDGKSQAYELAKAAEMLGLTQDPKKFDAVLEGWSQAITASGGKLQGSDFFSTVKYLRGGGQSMTMEFLTRIMPSLMQEMKTGKGSGQGGGAGNPLASMFAEVVGGQVSNKTVDALKQLHMIDLSKVTFTRGGWVKRLAPGAITGSNLEAQNPFEFVRDVLEPHLKKYTHYLDKNAQGELLHPGELRAMIAAVFPNRVAQQIASMMLTQQNRIAGDRALMESAMLINPAYDELVRHDPVLARQAMWEQLDRLQTDIGKAISPMVTGGIYKLAKAFAYLSEVVERHPVRTKVILEVAAAAAAILVVLGGLAMIIGVIGALAAIFTGGSVTLLVAGVAAAAVAITDWSDFLSKTDAFGQISDWLRKNDLFEELKKWITGESNNLAPALQSAVSKMLKAVFQSPFFTGETGPRTGGGTGNEWADKLNRWNANVAQAGKTVRKALDDAERTYQGWAIGLRKIVDNADLAFQAFAIGLRLKIVTGLKAVFTTLDKMVSDINARILACVMTIASSVQAFVGGVDKSITTSVMKWAADVKALAQSAWSSLTDSLGSLIKNLVGWLTNLPSRIWAALTGKAAVNLGPSPAESAIKSTQQNSSSSAVAIYMADHPGVTADAAAKAIMAKETVVPPSPANTNAVPATGAANMNAPGLPPTAQPGGTRGSETDPVHVMVLNQLDGSDIARGVSARQAEKVNRPPAGFTGSDPRADLQSYFYGNVASPHY